MSTMLLCLLHCAISNVARKTRIHDRVGSQRESVRPRRIEFGIPQGRHWQLCGAWDLDVACVALRDWLGVRAEEKFESPAEQEQVRMQIEGQAVIDNESRELIRSARDAIVAEAGQIYRGYTNSDHGIDGEIEFKDDGAAPPGSGSMCNSSPAIPTSRNARAMARRCFRSRTRAGPTTGSSRLTPSCWSSGRRTAKSAGWTSSAISGAKVPAAKR